MCPEDENGQKQTEDYAVKIENKMDTFAGAQKKPRRAKSVRSRGNETGFGFIAASAMPVPGSLQSWF